MSCKYSLATLLLLGSCLSLSLMCGPVDSNNVYARYDNYAYVGWASNQPASIGVRSSAYPTEEDVQRVQSNRVATPNNQRGSVRPGASSTLVPAPAAVSVAASSPAASAPAASAPAFESVQNRRTASRPSIAPALAPPPVQQQPPSVTTVLRNDAPGQAAPWPSATTGPVRPPPQFNYRERFSSTLLQPMTRSNLQRNVVYSPSSIHSILGMMFGVSAGQTALELQRAGQFSANQLDVAKDFQKVNNNLKQSGGAQLIVASNLYYNKELSDVNIDYGRYASEYYNSGIEAVNMKRPNTVADRINAWSYDATRGIIQNLVTPSDISENTEALLVNAIYFKARWATEFSVMDTTPEKFRVSNNAAISVPMMFNDDVFAYAELPDLDAKAIELPYAGTDVTMLLILPNRVDGLAQLEGQLATGIDLNVVASRLRRDTVTVRLPKFRVEFEQDITDALQQLGVRRMFTKDSEVVTMLSRPVQISKILQKAFIDVNEAGSEAAAASYAKFVPLSLPMQSREFTADHPFLFAIRTPDTVLFIGHVVQPTQ